LKENLKLKPSSMPSELRLIFSCLRASAGQNVKDQIEVLSRRITDWEAFIRLVDRHRVSSTVYRSLNRFAGDRVPEPVLARLKARFQTNTRQVISKTAELVRILRRFEQSGIPALPLKGPVLAIQIYGDLGSRHVGDLDIMVAPECVKKAEDLLLQEGYRRTHPGFEMTPRQDLAYVQDNKHFEYHCQGRRIRVELHWRFGSNRYLFPLKFDDAWKDRRILHMGGTDVASLSPKHTILFLSVHGSIHAWFRLFWLNDLACLLLRYQTIDWTTLMAHAGRLGIRRMVAEGAILSSLLLDSLLPQPVRAYADKDKGVYSLARMSLYLMKHPGGPSPRPFTHAYAYSKIHEFGLRSDPRYKLAFCLNQIGAKCGDWDKFPLPDAFFSFYYLIRPFFWFFRWYVRGTKVYREGPLGGANSDSAR
jgi:hypothetical protein